MAHPPSAGGGSDTRIAQTAQDHKSIILESWHRCQEFGLDQGARPDFDPLPRDLLSDACDRSSLLIQHARPVMDSLYEQIANTESMVVLTDPSGLILHSLGDDDFLERAQKVALRPGVTWSEGSRGTNAVGTAIANLAPTVVHGDEHYLAANQILTCSAVPITDPHGDLVGVLDISGDRRSYQRHTLALARMSCQVIENQMFRAAFPDALLIEFHSRPEFIGTLYEGIVAVGPDGSLLAANKGARAQLGLGCKGLRAHSTLSLLDTPMSSLLDHVRRVPDGLLPLTLKNGIRVFARLKAGGRLRPPFGILYDDATLRADIAATRESRDGRESPASAHEAKTGAVPDRACSLASLETGDAAVHATIAKLKKVIGRDIAILIHGETGTGKELLARAIHADSPRRDRPFVAVNCASIPEGLIESELFGYEEGAFTGASKKGAEGKIRQAHGGTLFLDEIGDMPPSLQARMLRVLQERVVTPLGSARTHPVDVAIICATHRRLKDAIAQGSFREDLYYRLNGLTVSLPPLRQRTDLATVARCMLERELDAGHLRISAAVFALFLRHPWPGNMRQMSNLLRTAVAMVDDDTIEIEHLPEDFLDDLAPSHAVADAGSAVPPAPTFTPPGREHDTRLDDMERTLIQQMLEHTGGNISETSRRLGISRNTIYRKLRKH